MTESATCPECGAELAAGSREAPCAACLMMLGMQSWTARHAGLEDDNGTPTATFLHRFAAPSPADLAARFPQLEILELRGQGGMGAVYKSRQKSLDRLVALKIINPEAANEPGFAGRFEREAKALARLNHPHIVGIHDFGQADGLFYFVMEYVDGVNLRTLIAKGNLQPVEALALVPQLCDALQFAHEEGIVHRDIKPENILVDKRGRVKIADFGLAKMLRLSAVGMTLTHTRQVVGTFHYMAPEQFERPGEIDHRVDIYALGVVFYEMLTGMLPVGRFDLPSQRCQVDARLDEVVPKALEREPDRRYQHASEVKTDVELLEATKPEGRVGEKRMSPHTRDIRLLEETRLALSMPATGMMVYGLLLLVGAIGASLGVCYAEIVHDAFWEPQGTEIVSLIGAICLGIGTLGIVVLVGGAKMRKLESFELAVAGAIIALISSISIYAAVISAPVGIWCLRWLRKPTVRRAFALQRQLERDDPELAARRKALQQVAGPAWGMIAIGALNVIVPPLVLALFVDYQRDIAWPILLSIPSGIVLLVSGFSMLRLRSRELSLVGALAALVPCGPLWLLSLPLGLVALLVIRKPEVQTWFGRTVELEFAGMGIAESQDEIPQPVEPSADLRPAEEQVLFPAIGLVLAGIFSAFFGVSGMIVSFVAMSGPVTSAYLLIGLPHALLVALTAPVLILGGLRMKQLEARWLALMAAIVALLPLNPAWLLSAPLGIWALVVLNRRAVEQAFGSKPMSWEAWEHSLGKAATLLKVGAVLQIMCLAPLWVFYAIEHPGPTEWWEVTIFLSLLSGAAVLAAVTTMAGANRMRHGLSRGWAFAGAIAALAPVTSAILVGVPAGSYALTLLTRQGIDQWFATPPAKELKEAIQPST